MEIGSIRHKALRRFAETGATQGLSGNLAPRLRNMLAWLSVIAEPDELKLPPNFGAHQLSGDRAGVWSLTVTRNWRIIFRVSASSTIEDLDLEDYH